ncbi:MAG: DUF4386 domain-containing protein [Dehalococcoidia bacterium]
MTAQTRVHNPADWDERTRKSMLATGILFIGTFIFSIPALFFYAPLLDRADYVVGGGHDTRVTIGALFEIILIVCNAGTAITLYPVVRRYTETVAIGYVASRLFESVMIALGVLSLLTVVTLRQDFGGVDAANAAGLTAAANALVAFHDWTFLLGPAFCAGFGNGILLGYMMYRSGLMPRRLALLGLVGGPIAVGTAVAVLFGAYEQVSPISFFFTFPEIIWELTFGTFLTVKALRLGRSSRAGSVSAAPGRAASAASL